MTNSRLWLPDVTLVSVWRDADLLTNKAITDTTDQIEFANGLLSSLIYKSYDETLWGLAFRVETSHMLIIQYDGFVLDASRWNPDWLNYDYIGAPWPWHKENKVGNGGFSLRSSRLMKFLHENQDLFPARFPEDDVLCRVYRPALEAHGFKWASVEVASAFSFEREAPRPTFGFHGLFNFPKVLSKQRYIERIALADDYVRSKPEWKELWEPT